MSREDPRIITARQALADYEHPKDSGGGDWRDSPFVMVGRLAGAVRMLLQLAGERSTSRQVALSPAQWENITTALLDAAEYRRESATWCAEGHTEGGTCPRCASDQDRAAGYDRLLRDLDEVAGDEVAG